MCAKNLEKNKALLHYGIRLHPILIKENKYSVGLCCSLILSLLVALSATAQQITVTELPTQEFLPTAHIHRMFQDSEGYMWYATEGGGLCRDNGYQIEVFRSDANTPHLLASNTITCIAESHPHKIWFGTERGLYVLNKNNYQITVLPDKELEGKKIDAIKTCPADKRVWVAAGPAIYCYSPEGVRLNKYPSLWNSNAKSITGFYEDSRHTLWALQWQGGILQYHKGKDEFMQAAWTCPAHPIQMIEDAEHGKYYVATWGKGIVRFTPLATPGEASCELQPATYDDSPGNPHKAQCLGLLQDRNLHLLWVAAMDNLYAYRITGDQLQPVSIEDFLPKGRKILDQIIEDRSGNVWVPGYSPHSFILSFGKNRISRYPVPAATLKTGYPLIADAVIKDEDYLWIWQGRTGLSLYRPATDHIAFASDFPKESGRHHFSKIMEKRRTGPGVWVACHNAYIQLVQNKGMNIVTTGKIKLPHPAPIHALHEDRQGRLYIGTDNAIYYYSVTGRRISKLCGHTSRINDIACTADGTVYCATESRGLIYITPDGKIHQAGGDENHSSVAVGPNETVWTATLQGNVYSYRPQDKKLVTAESACNMNGDAIKAMRADPLGHLWIMADQYVKEYNPKNQSFRIVYNSDHDIKVDYFLSLQKEDDGNICMGGIGAFCIASPSTELDRPPTLVKPVITSVKVDGTQRLMGVNEKQLTLECDHANLEVSFSTLEHLYARKISYAYRLKGADSTWHYLPQGINTAYFTKLPKGDYSLEIKATDVHGCWSQPVACLQLHRLPAWYETWWAYSLFVASGILLLTGFFRFHFNRMHRKQEALMEQQLTQMKFKFFTNISHELRTPLTLIITPLGSLLASMQEGKMRQQLSSVYRHAEELLQLVNQLLDFRKLETGSEKLILANGEINEFTASICEAFQPMARSKHIVLSFLPLKEALYMHFDRDKLHRIIYNLLSNAFKFTPAGGDVTVSLHTIDREDKHLLCICVKDTGEGIEESETAHLFDRYYQTASVRRSTVTGSGIGLHIVKEYTTMHQGSVEVESVRDTGTTFRIFIPITPGNKIPLTQENVLPENTTPENSRKHILVVEDNEEFRKFMTAQLAGKYNVWEASDGEEAEKTAGEKDIDLIVSDVMMPGISGFELCSRLKQNIKTSHLPIILLTARTGDESELEGYKSGADCYLTKPFNMEILINRIAHLIDLQEKRKQIFLEGIEIPTENITSSQIDEEFLKKAISKVEKNICDSEYNVELFSSDMCMSRMSLYRKLQSITGQKPTEFIRSIRLKKAARLLKDSNLTVVEISEKVGFSTPSYFSKCFKEMFGVLPTQYARE